MDTDLKIIEVQIKAMARRMSRWVRDDCLEMRRDLEMAGWIAYFENKDDRYWSRRIKTGMGDALCMWQRGVNYRTKQGRERVPVRATFTYDDRIGSLRYGHSPEDELIAIESAKSEFACRSEKRLLKRKSKTHCKHGHSLLGGNLELVRCIKDGRRYIAQRCLVCKRESQRRRRIKEELKIIGVLNLELQKEIANAEHK